MPPVARFMGAALAALAAYGCLSIVRIAPASASAQAPLALALLLALSFGVLTPVRTRIDSVARQVALASALLAVAEAVLIQTWLRGDPERFLWIIRQGGVCAYAGGKASAYLVFAGAVFAIGTATWAVVGSPRPLHAVRAATVAAMLAAASAAVMLIDPRLFAGLLGCL